MNGNRTPRKSNGLQSSSSRLKANPSPRKNIATHTLLKEDKLKVIFQRHKGLHKV